MSELYYSLLEKNHLSNTRVRSLIFSILKEQDKPVPYPTLINLAQLKDIHRSSVYRTIDSFEKAGIIKKLYTGWKESVELSEVFRHHHHHMTCNSCNKTISFNETPALEDELILVASYHDFHPDNHSIEFSGLCADCYKL
jgi:Fur family ferric uptake transcriptional regulator